MNRAFILLFSLLFILSSAWAASAQSNLYHAAEHGDVAALRKALKAGADVDKQDKDGWTALLFAATEGQEQAVRLLLSAGADPNLAGNKGETALLGAVMSDKADLVKALLDAGADPRARLNTGMSALDLARQGGDAALVRLLQPSAATSGLSPQIPTHQTQNTSTRGSINIEDLRRVLPDWAAPVLTEKCIEFLNRIAATASASKAHKEEVSNQTFEDNRLAAVSKREDSVEPLLPGVEYRKQHIVTEVQTATGGTSESTADIETVNIGGCAVSKSQGDSPYTGKDLMTSTTYIKSYSGSLFPIKVGNELKIATVTTTVMTYPEKPELNSKHESSAESTSIVVDEISGQSIKDFPMPLSGKIFKVASSSKLSGIDKEVVNYMWYSEELGQYLSHDILDSGEINHSPRYKEITKTVRYELN